MILPTLAPELIGHLGTLPLTNTLISVWGTVALLFLLAGMARFHLRDRPGKIQSILEASIDVLLSYLDRITNDRTQSWKLLPFSGGIFLFVLALNWLGLMPGVGSIFFTAEHHGELARIPLFRSGSTDLNLTLALALVTVFTSHLFAVQKLGIKAHVSKFIHAGSILRSLRTLSPLKIFTSIVHGVVGIFELIGEFAKLASLSLRLFGNVFAGEVLLTVMSSLLATFLPVPFLLLEFGVGLIQALVFALLSSVYLHVMMKQPHHENAEPAHS